MGFTFLHAADLHLGSPFQGLSLRDPRMAERFGAASREAFEELITRALEEERIAFAIFAGDIFDGDWRDASAALFFNRQIARLTREGAPVYLLKGNHDAESVVTKSLSLPEGAHEFPARRAKTFVIEELRVALHGRSFADRAESGNFVPDYPEPKPGWLNIGVLHSSLDGRPGHASYAPCALNDLRARAYDYWALGHVHAHEVVCEDPFVVYPGNLQGRSIRECGEKGAVLVDVEDGAVKGLRRLIVDRARFAEICVDASPLETPEDLRREITERAARESERAGGRFLAARLRVQGASALHFQLAADPSDWREQVEAWLHHAGEAIELEKFVVETRAPHAPEKRDSELDFAALLDEVLGDPAFAEEARAALAAIEQKMPPKSELPRDNFEALLAEARDLALARAQRSDS
jgi:DNA repair exonuclease SbcCD nuclease subunit